MLPVSIEPMRLDDIPAVMSLDRVCFRSPWLADSYKTELGNRAAQYFVARVSGQIVGYGGTWVIDHEAHITTIAVSPELRRRGVAERLLFELLNEAILRHAHRISLEVRAGNVAARGLYSKYQFCEVELRPGYYVDNGEDALMLRVDNVHLPQYLCMLRDAAGRLGSRK